MTTITARPDVGQRLTSEDVVALPSGAVAIYTRTGTVWTKQSNGFWHSDAGASSSPETMSRRAGGGHLTLHELPGPTPEPPLPEVDTTEETPAVGITLLTSLDEVKALFATVALGGQQINGVNYSTVANALEKIKIAPDRTPDGEGAPVCMADQRLINRLPDHTLLVTRTDPDDEKHSVFQKTPGGLSLLMGSTDYDHYTLLRIMSRPDGVKVEWSGSESEPQYEAILKFKKSAWKVTRNVKSSTGWCGVLEDVVKRAGVTADIESMDSVPLTAEQIAELPEGTVLKYAAAGQSRSVLYVRDDSADNPAKTRRIGGSLPGSWLRSGAWVARRAEAEVSIQVHSRDEMASMPIGTVIGDGSYRYTKFETNDGDGVRRREWRTVDAGRTYIYCANDFSIGSMRYSSIPGVA